MPGKDACEDPEAPGHQPRGRGVSLRCTRRCLPPAHGAQHHRQPDRRRERPAAAFVAAHRSRCASARGLGRDLRGLGPAPDRRRLSPTLAAAADARSAARAGACAATFGMTHRTRVKICGITRSEDALAAARSGADAVGLIFWDGTPRRVAPAQARSIAAALPPFVSVVGLFVDPTADEVRAVLDVLPLDSLQFHGSEPVELCRSFGRPYIKAIAVAPGIDLLQCAVLY